MTTGLIERAALVSRIAHRAVGQLRKYTNEPYHLHPEAVAQMVSQVEGVTTNMICAAYLHDVLEDTQVMPIDIATDFNAEVMTLVHELTDQFEDPSYGNRAYRKRLEAARLSTISAAAQTIKYADLIHNTESIVRHDPGFAQVYLPEKRRILEVMNQGDEVLYRLAMHTLQQAEVEVERVMEERREQTYKVYINGRHSRTVFTEQEAWDHIGKHPMGTLHKVCDAEDEIRPEFVPY